MASLTTLTETLQRVSHELSRRIASLNTAIENADEDADTSAKEEQSDRLMEISDNLDIVISDLVDMIGDVR